LQNGTLKARQRDYRAGMNNATTTCFGADASGTYQCLTAYGRSSSTDPIIFNGFTGGELVISVMLFLVLVANMVAAYHIIFRKIKIKNQ
jgi:hypothetical protein